MLIIIEKKVGEFMAEKKTFKEKVKKTYNTAKTKVKDSKKLYDEIYNEAYVKGWEDCKNGNSPLFAGLVGAVGYGNGF